MSSAIIKRSVILHGRKTSVSLEDEFWTALNEIAGRQRVTVSNLVQQIDRNRGDANLSSAIRVYVFNHVRASDKAVQQPEGLSSGVPLQTVY